MHHGAESLLNYVNVKCKLIGWWAFFQSASDLFRTCEFLDKTSQKAEETLVMMIDNAQETKL